jgi:hypothetical protein
MYANNTECEDTRYQTFFGWHEFASDHHLVSSCEVTPGLYQAKSNMLLLIWLGAEDRLDESHADIDRPHISVGRFTMFHLTDLSLHASGPRRSSSTSSQEQKLGKGDLENTFIFHDGYSFAVRITRWVHTVGTIGESNTATEGAAGNTPCCSQQCPKLDKCNLAG